MDAILRPKSVAVIGASTIPGKLGNETLKNILDGGFRGAVYPINPKAETILNVSCYPGIKETPGPVNTDRRGTRYQLPVCPRTAKTGLIGVLRLNFFPVGLPSFERINRIIPQIEEPG